MRWLFVAILVLALLGYGLFETHTLIEGPQISIQTPQDGSATSSGLVLISGTAENIAFLTINDAPAYTDPSGHFAQLYSPPPGYTVVTVAATDRFGRRASKSIAFIVVNYCPLT